MALSSKNKNPYVNNTIFVTNRFLLKNISSPSKIPPCHLGPSMIAITIDASWDEFSTQAGINFVIKLISLFVWVQVLIGQQLPP